MAESDSGGPYRCPLCRVPAPSVAACKIHISRSEDTLHVGYVGNDLHEEIVTGQVVEHPADDGTSSIAGGGLHLVSSVKRLLRELAALLR